MKSALGLDRAIAYTVLGRGWSVLAGPVTLFLIVRYLTSDEQGYYYTFYSVLGLQVFFELGLSIVLLQFASHEKGKLEWTEAGTLEGDPEAKARLASLLAKSVKWYGVVGLLMILTLIPGGILFFQKNRTGAEHVQWLVPWIGVVLIEAGSIVMSPVTAILEGCGLVSQVAMRRAMQGVVGSLATWLLLVANGRLFTAPVLSAVGLIWWSTWLFTSKRAFLNDLLATRQPALTKNSPPQGAEGRVRGADENVPVKRANETDAQTLATQSSEIHWWTEVWPFQWKIALSGISGYFIFLIFNPVLFMFHGPKAAGQMGMSLSVMSAVATVAAAWISTKMSPFGAHIARREFDRLDALFFPALRRSLVVIVVAGGLFWMLVFALHRAGHPLAERVLPPLPLAFFVGTTVLNHLLGAEAIYLRAHKDEPFLWLSVVVALLVIASTYFLGRQSVTAMMAGNFFVTLLGLAWGTAIFVRKRELWHRPLAEPSL